MSETIRDLKERLYAATTIPVDYQALIHNCRRLKHEKTLFDYNIKDEDTIHQTLPFKAELEGSRFESSHIHLYQKSGARSSGREKIFHSAGLNPTVSTFPKNTELAVIGERKCCIALLSRPLGLNRVITV